MAKIKTKFDRERIAKAVVKRMRKQGKRIENAAKQSPLLAEAQKNTTGMLEGMMHSLGFQQVNVTFATTAAAPGR